MSSKQATRLGFLRTCIDRRFVTATRNAFEYVTNLEPTRYWHEAYAGGAALLTPNTAGVDHAAYHGATIFGWQAHLNGCGGQPGVSDKEIIDRLHRAAVEMASKFLDAKHVFILASDNGLDLEEIIDELHRAAAEMASKYPDSMHVLILAFDDTVDLEKKRCRLLQTAKEIASKYPDSGHIRILVSNDGINIQELFDGMSSFV